MAKFQLPQGQLLAAIFLPPGTVIDNASGVYKVTSCPLNRGLVGYSVPTFFPGPDAIPSDQASYDLMRTRYANRRIVTFSDAGITRNYNAFATPLVSGQDPNEVRHPHRLRLIQWSTPSGSSLAFKALQSRMPMGIDCNRNLKGQRQWPVYV
jgi:hypothetical protein